MRLDEDKGLPERGLMCVWLPVNCNLLGGGRAKWVFRDMEVLGMETLEFNTVQELGKE